MKIQQWLVKLWPRQGINYQFPYLWSRRVTLTFDISGIILNATHLLVRANNYNKYYEYTTITCHVMTRTGYQLHIFNLRPLSMTFTFDKESWVLYATRLLTRVNISTKYYEDTTITCGITARTRSDGLTDGRTDANTLNLNWKLWWLYRVHCKWARQKR